MDQKETKQSDIHKCSDCKVKSVRCDLFDAYFCPKCERWLEDKCKDPACKFCANRPDCVKDIKSSLEEVSNER